MNPRDASYFVRAGGLNLIEAGAAEAVYSRAPWLKPGPLPGETWLGLLRFSEAARAARLPRLSAAEDTTAVAGPALVSFSVWATRAP